MTWVKPDDFNPDVIVMNPPFSTATDIIEKIHSDFGNIPIVAMNRLDWLSSKKRKSFFEKHPVNALWTLSKRPSFVESNKVSVWSFGWMWWNIGDQYRGVRSV